MRRYWLSEEAFSGTDVLIQGTEFKHIFQVCRCGVGDKFEVLQGDQKARLVQVVEIQGKQARCEVLETRKMPDLPKPHIHLALSVSKPSTMEKVFEKAVELGVKEVHLFPSDFSYSKFKKNEYTSKKNRWDRIIQGATQQSGRGDLMKLTFCPSLSVLLGESQTGERALGIFAYEAKGDQNLTKVLQSRPADLDNLWIFVGSEGGFSHDDVKLFSDYKMIPTTLGEQVLRVETACVTLVSIIKYELGLL